ncbi:HPr kinase/phosphorylase [Coxiella-like endosymbiont]|uniref:HPr kinase/phosphorylase n=1 Tax=Coxiella-like endosymbiont TaxID=1592897 RepID=UPI002869707B|nr:HPr kinase/phosphorylase [Coxiella-like endosymbiont]
MLPYPSPEITSKLSMTNQTTLSLHANFLVINKLGVLIMGEPNIGKSELTLALLDRGHQMVCDDLVDLVYQNNQLIGKCPAITCGYILISDVGMMNVSKLFGTNAIISQYEINLIITLIKPENKLKILDPFNPICEKETILEVTLPKIILPVYTGRNLPLLIEILVRNQILKKKAMILVLILTNI